MTPWAAKCSACWDEPWTSERASLGANEAPTAAPPMKSQCAGIAKPSAALDPQLAEIGIDLELIEVQTGSYLGEDDIIRIEDDYQRS